MSSTTQLQYKILQLISVDFLDSYVKCEIQSSKYFILYSLFPFSPPKEKKTEEKIAAIGECPVGLVISADHL
jgi:hypothetical protein